MSEARILVAGIGNIFLGDDAFGSEVARQLLASSLPAEVKVVDFGIRGFDLTYALLDDYDLTILVDATPRGGEPGTLYTIEPDPDEFDELDFAEATIDTHAMNPMRVLAMVQSMGGRLRNIVIVGCEPTPLDNADGEMGLSEPVTSAIPGAIAMIGALVTKHRTERGSAGSIAR
jgi:hydrogenase maturation protease